MNTEMIWIVVGILLILAELVATQVVAVFIGIAAIEVGLLMLTGVVEAPAAQFAGFAVLSVVLLFATRRHLKNMLVGAVADERDAPFGFTRTLASTCRSSATSSTGAAEGVVG
ncbi:NfeD family protein [Ectothiorhodospiraceae bacterium 2226]|nr:NfeD family protein [Ectothiorhodospiraceae bacterium 2226]